MTKSKLTDIDYAEKANSFHLEVINAQVSAIHAARNAGAALVAAKRLVYKQAGNKKGTWTAWLEANFKASVQTARVYVRIAANWKELEPVLSPASSLSLDRALKILKVKPEPFEKQPMDERDKCRRALFRSFEMFIRDNLSDAELIFLTGWGKFIGEHYSQFYDELLENIKREVGPIAGPFVEASSRWWAALKSLIKTRTLTEETRRPIDDRYALELAMEFKNATLTEYQRNIIYCAVQSASKGVIPREVLSHYMPREPECPRDWIASHDRRSTPLRRAG